MKKIIFIFLSIILIGVWSCSDCPDSPYQTGSSFKSKRKVLLEEFTGFRCTNCPPAALQATALMEAYPDNLILVAIHSSVEFAAPLSDVEGEPFSTDFRTTAGEEYLSFFEIPGFPAGLIDRIELNNYNVIAPGDWGTAISNELLKESELGVKFKNVTFDEASRKLNVEVEAEVQSENLSGNQYNFTLYFTESNIIEAQEYPGGAVDSSYKFNHVLRANLNGTWGEPAFEGILELGQTKTYNYEYIVPENFVVANSELVGYVYNNSSNLREVLQAEEYKLDQLE
jgi:thiol-disulfide isomerase/thioredoxin